MDTEWSHDKIRAVITIIIIVDVSSHLRKGFGQQRCTVNLYQNIFLYRTLNIEKNTHHFVTVMSQKYHNKDVCCLRLSVDLSYDDTI